MLELNSRKISAIDALFLDASKKWYQSLDTEKQSDVWRQLTELKEKLSTLGDSFSYKDIEEYIIPEQNLCVIRLFSVYSSMPYKKFVEWLES